MKMLEKLNHRSLKALPSRDREGVGALVFNRVFNGVTMGLRPTNGDEDA